MYYIIYQTTNLVNGKYYVGKWETASLKQSYLGSGKLLRKAIEKYGIDNFEREELMFCQSSKELNEIERLIVDEVLVKDERCYNLALGGSGGDLGPEVMKSIGRKGRTPWNKGKKCPGVGGVKKGNIPWNKGKKGSQVAWNKGLKRENNEI